MYSVILSQQREHKMGVVRQDVGTLTTAHVKLSNLLETSYLKLREAVVKRITVNNLGVSDGGNSGIC